MDDVYPRVGGKYTMTKRTPVWIDNPGDCSGVMLVGVRSYLNAVLVTRREGLE